MILVTGATGNVGGHIVAQLVRSGYDVRALTHRSDHDLPPGARVSRGDLADASTLNRALADVDRMFVFPAPDFDEAVPERAVAHGVQHAVVLSSAALERTDPARNPIARRHKVVEDAVRRAGLSYTILRSDTFAANALRWARSIREARVVRAPYPYSHRSPIHEADVAAVAVEALVNPEHEGRFYVLTGPAGITQAQQVDDIAAVIGEPIRLEELDRDVALDEMVDSGISSSAAERLLDYMARCVDEPSEVTTTVVDVTGHPARPFRTWVRDHIAAFR